MEEQAEVEGEQTEKSSRVQSLLSSIKTFKKRAQSSLLCKNVRVAPLMGNFDQQNEGDGGNGGENEEEEEEEGGEEEVVGEEVEGEVAAPNEEQEREAPADNDQAIESLVEIVRTFGIADLRAPELDDEDDAADEGEVNEGDNHDVDASATNDDHGKESPDLEVEKDEDTLWEENMYRKLYELKQGRMPVEFRLYLVDMIRYSANIDDLRSISVYIRQLETDYDVYDKYEKILKDREDSRSKTKFRVDRVAEDLIMRLATIKIGSDVDWKRTVGIICDRLRKNMLPKVKADLKSMPLIFSDGMAATMNDVRDALIYHSTIDMTGHDLVEYKEGVHQRRRMVVFMSMIPSCLVQLNLSNTGLNRRHVTNLLPLLSALPNLQELDLRSNRISAGIFKNFLPYLTKMDEKIRPGFPSLRWVHFNHNVDIHRLPAKFLAEMERRWPRGEYRPTAREMADGRATICDFKRVEARRKKLIRHRRRMEKERMRRRMKKRPLTEKETLARENKRRYEILRVLAEKKGRVKHRKKPKKPTTSTPRSGTSNSRATAPSASLRDTQNNTAAAAIVAPVASGAVGSASNDAVLTPRVSNAARAVQVAINQNVNANNARGRNIHDDDHDVVVDNAADRFSHGDDSRSNVRDFYRSLAGDDYEFIEGVRLLDNEEGPEYILYVFRPLNRQTTRRAGVSTTMSSRPLRNLR